MNTLQSVVLPKINICTEEQLYFRISDHSSYCYETQTLFLGAGGRVSFDTYFNQFSTNKWKHFSLVERVVLEMEVNGEGLVTVVMDQPKHTSRVIAQQTISSSDFSFVRIDLGRLGALNSGLLSFRLQTQTKLEFKSARFITDDRPSQEVVLGITITAFKRDEYVLPAIVRLHNDLLSTDDFKSRMRLIVVDNGGTLSGKDVPDTCKVIQNRNLGGAGGFARGLFHFEGEVDGVTHCLFMDDDASCESEALKRTYSLLSYAKKSNLAVAGAMMLEKVAFLQHENGAYFDMRCIPLKNGLDLRSPAALLENDVIEHIGYGAWWYFAFPLSSVQKYPFPFFVRGDDVSFSMANCFEIATLNGVASWQESFAWKTSPQTVYLDMRSNICQYLLTDKLAYSVKKLLMIFGYFFLKNNLAYHYASAEAMCMAVEDVLGPTSFWRKNMDMSEKRGQLSPLASKEKLVPMDAPSHPLKFGKENLLMKLLRWATLNGHLIPFKLLLKSATLEKTEGPFLRKVFGYREINIYHLEDKTGYKLTHNKAYFFRNLFRAGSVALKLLLSSRQLKRKEKELEQFMTSEFWREQFELTSNREFTI